jgi:hypothetical protein
MREKQLDWHVVEAGRILSRYVQPDSISMDVFERDKSLAINFASMAAS